MKKRIPNFRGIKTILGIREQTKTVFFILGEQISHSERLTFSISLDYRILSKFHLA